MDLNKQLNRLVKNLRKPVKRTLKAGQKYVQKNPREAMILVIAVVLGLLYLRCSGGVMQLAGNLKEGYGERQVVYLYGGSTGVMELGSKDFVKGLNRLRMNNKGKKGIVVAYMTSCPHCKVMVDEYLKLARMADRSKNMVMAINRDAEPTLMEQLGVKSFPTIKLVDSDGYMLDYAGARNAKEMLEAIHGLN